MEDGISFHSFIRSYWSGFYCVISFRVCDMILEFEFKIAKQFESGSRSFTNGVGDYEMPVSPFRVRFYFTMPFSIFEMFAAFALHYYLSLSIAICVKFTKRIQNARNWQPMAMKCGAGIRLAQGSRTHIDVLAIIQRTNYALSNTLLHVLHIYAQITDANRVATHGCVCCVRQSIYSLLDIVSSIRCDYFSLGQECSCRHSEIHSNHFNSYFIYVWDKNKFRVTVPNGVWLRGTKEKSPLTVK